MSTPRNPPTRDPPPMLTVPVTERDHHIHPVGARYTLVEYGDYECPDCAEGYHVVKELLNNLEEDLCYVFRNFPKADLHPNAQFAAEAAEAADLQAKFWLMHDRLFEHQSELSSPRIRQLARELPIDMHRFEVDLEAGDPKRRVDSDRAEGEWAGVQSTPTFFVNGRMFMDSSEYDPLFEALTTRNRANP